MTNIGGKLLWVFCAAAVTMCLFAPRAMAVDTMADWTGQNTVMPDFAPDNNYGKISDTSVGGQVQSKVNFVGLVSDVNEHFVYLSDPTLEGPTLDFTTPLHMHGTITFNSPQPTEPNICFCWYNSSDTRHRIGLGISNLSVAQGGAVADRLRIDFGYAATGGNRFPFVSADGTASQDNLNSLIPNGTYPFTFDYTPGPEGQAGGVMSATVGDYFRVIQPLETQPWDTDFFTFDRFGIVQRATTNTTQLGFYDVVFSNVTYTGGTPIASLPGDYNEDGAVDAADYVVWRKNPAAHGGDPEGYDTWRTNFGVSSGGGAANSAAAAVPEPATFMFAAAAALGLIAARRRLSW